MPTTMDQHERLVDTLGRLRVVTAEAAARVEQVTGMHATQVATMDAIADGETTVSGVARATLAHVSSASRTVDGLVRDGFVDRARDAQDRRAVVLSLTAAGRRQVARIDRLRRDLVEVALRAIDPDERERFAVLLDRCVDGLRVALDHVDDERGG
jgi:DNA-binding MarR family transcriptional regulator